MSLFIDIPSTGQMLTPKSKREAWILFRSIQLECALYSGAHLLAEKYHMEVDEGFILETVIEKPEKEKIECYA